VLHLPPLLKNIGDLQSVLLRNPQSG
jgi:hypothetical protein